jgi:hypothetical protein
MIQKLTEREFLDIYGPETLHHLLIDLVNGIIEDGAVYSLQTFSLNDGSGLLIVEGYIKDNVGHIKSIHHTDEEFPDYLLDRYNEIKKINPDIKLTHLK